MPRPGRSIRFSLFGFRYRFLAGIARPVKNSNAAALNCAMTRSIAAILDPSATNTASA
jgi:hypothetical protein